MDHYVGQRLSLKGQLCTVRYVGPVADKPGSWLGVEWDDRDRGKHNGTHAGVKYFECRSKSSTAASFLRPNQSWDPARTFLQALREKYMPDFNESDAQFVYFSGKQAEEIGFEKFHQRQAKLQGIRVLVLDHVQVQHRSYRPEDEHAISEICAEITDLDLSGNLFETFGEIVQLCKLLPKLRMLTLDGNRIEVNDQMLHTKLPHVQTISLSRTLLNEDEVKALVSENGHGTFPSLKTLSLADNEYEGPLNLKMLQSVSSLDLSDNRLDALSDLIGLDTNSPLLSTLILKRNRISMVRSGNAAVDFALPISELDLSYNSISSFDFFNHINTTKFPRLKHLRVTGNPLYRSLISAEGKTLITEDGYMLTIARVPQLEYLNYSKITEKERLNAETYYLGQIAVELSQASSADQAKVLSRHSRYKELCEEYGEPNVRPATNSTQLNPNSLAARLVTTTFTLSSDFLPHLEERSWTEEIPKSFNIYSLLGIVGKKLDRLPLELRLVLETNEKDPTARDSGYDGPEWWDSDEDEAEAAEDEWVKRELELVAGTRALGTFVEGAEAVVRVEHRHGDS